MLSFLIASYRTKYENHIKINKKFNKKNLKVLKDDLLVNNEEELNDYKNSFKFQNMFPMIYKNSNSHFIHLKKEDLFNAREMYINEAKLTPDYIKYIRSFKETDQEKPKDNLKEKEIIIDNNIYRKRLDQYNYTDFCNFAIN